MGVAESGPMGPRKELLRQLVGYEGQRRREVRECSAEELQSMANEVNGVEVSVTASPRLEHLPGDSKDTTKLKTKLREMQKIEAAVARG